MAALRLLDQRHASINRQSEAAGRAPRLGVSDQSSRTTVVEAPRSGQCAVLARETHACSSTSWLQTPITVGTEYSGKVDLPHEMRRPRHRPSVRCVTLRQCTILNPFWSKPLPSPLPPPSPTLRPFPRDPGQKRS